MERIYRTRNVPLPAWVPHEYALKENETKDDLPTEGVPAGSFAYKVKPELVVYLFDGEAWGEA